MKTQGICPKCGNKLFIARFYFTPTGLLERLNLWCERCETASELSNITEEILNRIKEVK